jgi:4-hydroxybenzoate polyprenyltransferase
MTPRLPKLRHLLALSRAPHAVMDVASPALVALLWLGGLPELRVIAVGLVTALAAYLAVYALNDIVDRHEDRRRAVRGRVDASGYLDAALSRHPLAAGLLTTPQAAIWAGAWAALAVTGAAVLNPVCLGIFLAGCALEAVYCRLCCVTPLRALVSGVVKTLGPLAAVFAVDPQPRLLPLALVFAWFFLVEIGGQNIPSDWTDVEEDRGLGAKTIPVRLGPRRASLLVLVTLVLAVGAQEALLWVLSGPHLLWSAVVSLVLGALLLVVPAVRLCTARDRKAVFTLFNRASGYPLAMLVGSALRVLL